MTAPRTDLVLLGVTGSIAAYKAVEVARRLGAAGCRVQVLMTASAARFVTPTTFEAITGRPVLDDPWARRSGEIAHVERADEAALLLVAPASAHTLARLALGLADDILTATALSTGAPIVVAPAMEHGMWHHPATQAHVRTLESRGVVRVGPATGALASGRSGDGRMAEPAEVAEAALLRLRGPARLAGRRILVTAGPTWEPIDPVRVLSNRSTGAMGIAIADEAARRGAQVDLVLGPTHLAPIPAVRAHRVETAAEMLASCLERLEGVDFVVGAAAVSDYRPAAPRDRKLKRGGEDGAVLALEENPDIIATLAAGAGPSTRVIGFAAETEDLVENARGKLDRKRLHAVVGNQVGVDAGFGPAETRVVLVRPGVEPHWSAPGDKAAMARFIWDQLEEEG